VGRLSVVYRDAWTTLYHGRAEDLIPLLPIDQVDLVLTDPPYGVSEKTLRGENRRSHKLPALNFDPIEGDAVPFDPRRLLKFRRLALFGGNFYADKLPPSPTWIVWDKLNGLSTVKKKIGFCDSADVELIWTNLGGPARMLHHRWMGLLKQSERQSPRLHPTQKPIAVMSAILDAYSQPGDLIADFYMGSGPVVLAARKLSRRCLAIDCEEQWCRLTLERLYAEFPEDHPRAATAVCSTWRSDDVHQPERTDDSDVRAEAEAGSGQRSN
jgi:DNA modification methylase